jgi:hypothetical protein
MRRYAAKICQFLERGWELLERDGSVRPEMMMWQGKKKGGNAGGLAVRFLATLYFQNRTVRLPVRQIAWGFPGTSAALTLPRAIAKVKVTPGSFRLAGWLSL